MRPLDGRIAVVAGATRGAGRAIAVELGAAGATVYCTGRSTRAGRSDLDRAETIEETADLVTAAGGRGIAVRTDHTVPADVEALFARVRDEQDGRLDVLVNDVWGGEKLVEWGKKAWELDPERARVLLERAVFSHLLTARHGLPLMVARGQGLLVEVTDGDTFEYRGNLVYDLVKTGVIRLAQDLARDLEGTGVTSVAVTPGFLRSEEMLDHFGVTEATWRDAIAKEPYFEGSETPTFVGRAVAALAADPDVHTKAGRALASWHLGREYGFSDADGRQPHWQEFYERKRQEIGRTTPLP